MAKNGKCSLVLGINRDLFEDGSLSESFYREAKNGGDFNLIFETNRNRAGYSKDVHGQLNVIQFREDANVMLLGEEMQ